MICSILAQQQANASQNAECHTQAVYLQTTHTALRQHNSSQNVSGKCNAEVHKKRSGCNCYGESLTKVVLICSLKKHIPNVGHMSTLNAMKNMHAVSSKQAHKAKMVKAGQVSAFRLTKSSQGWPELVCQAWPGFDWFYRTKEGHEYW